MVDFIDELKWRGLIHDSTPGLQEYLKNSSIEFFPKLIEKKKFSKHLYTIRI